MSIIKAIEKSNIRAKERGWTEQYYFFDIHETILYPDYNNQEEYKFYPYAKKVLQYLSKQKEIVMCLYTCSYPEEIIKYMEFFELNHIKFSMVNENIEVKNTKYGFYEDKPYFNVLFEDKSGFDAEVDWIKLAGYYKLFD